jgi:hypothetical protein
MAPRRRCTARSLRLAALVLVVPSVLLRVADGQAAGTDGGPPACATHDQYQLLLEQVATNCCDQFEQTSNCDGGVPQVCDTRCAPAFLNFYSACEDYLQTQLSSPFVRQQFTSTRGRCHATVQANEVHDTDLVAPGEQHDMTTKLGAGRGGQLPRPAAQGRQLSQPERRADGRAVGGGRHWGQRLHARGLCRLYGRLEDAGRARQLPGAGEQEHRAGCAAGAVRRVCGAPSDASAAGRARP